VRVAVITFPGANCDQDSFYALRDLGVDVRYVWHGQHHLGKMDAVILPGGFSYGDALRAGAIARFAPIMSDVIEFAKGGGYVLAICNGFQIACEAGLLPGALMRNVRLKFINEDVYLKVENRDTAFTRQIAKPVIRIPIAHNEGCYTADEPTLDRLESNRQVVFRYVSPKGERDLRWNPNGAMRDIAGIINEWGNVLGLMPHPERACDALLGNTDGLGVFQSLLNAVHTRTSAGVAAGLQSAPCSV